MSGGEQQSSSEHLKNLVLWLSLTAGNKSHKYFTDYTATFTVVSKSGLVVCKKGSYMFHGHSFTYRLVIVQLCTAYHVAST